MSKLGDPRLCDLLEKSFFNESPKATIGILGYPCDMGGRLNSSTIGTKDGPDVIRDKLFLAGPLVNPEFNIDITNLCLFDHGNIAITPSLVLNQMNLTRSVELLFKENDTLIVLGGSRDQSYFNARGLMNTLNSGNIGVINIDAHLDIRPLAQNKYVHNGNPFRQLLIDQDFKSKGKFHEFGTQGSLASIEHTRFVLDNNAGITWLSDIRKSDVDIEFKKVLDDFGEKDVFVSIDIDVVSGADCPGVSSFPVGLSSQEVLNICFSAGKHKHTKLLDFSEFCPKIEKDRTAKLIVNMIYYFLMGVASRE